MRGGGRMLSVYISNEAIQAAQGSAGKNNVNVKQIINEPLDEGCILNGVITNPQALSKKLELTWSKHRLPTKNIHLSVDGNAILTRVMEAPLLPPKKMLSYIYEEFYEIENRESMVYDDTVLKPLNAQGGATILAAFAERDFINEYIELFKTAKLRISSINIALCGAINIMSRIIQYQSRTYILAVFDKITVSEMLYINGSFRFAKRVRLMAQPESSEFFTELAQSLSGLIQFNKSEKSGFDITDIYFCGDFEGMKKTCFGLAEALNVAVSELPDVKEIKFRGYGKLSSFIYPVGGLITTS